MIPFPQLVHSLRMYGGILPLLIHVHSMVFNEALGKTLGTIYYGLNSSLWKIHSRTHAHHTHTFFNLDAASRQICNFKDG